MFGPRTFRLAPVVPARPQLECLEVREMPAVAAAPTPAQTERLQFERYILQQQLPGGAFRAHIDAAVIPGSTSPAAEVKAYEANLAMLSLLRSGQAANAIRRAVIRGLTWTLAAVQADGTIRDHYYDHPNGTQLLTTAAAESDAAALGSTLAVAGALYGRYADDAQVARVLRVNRTKLILAGNRLMGLIDPADDLAWNVSAVDGLPRVKSLEDNSVARSGLNAAAALSRTVLARPGAARTFQLASNRLASAILLELYNRDTGRFRPVKFSTGVYQEVNPAVVNGWDVYDRLTVWPILFGVAAPRGPYAESHLTGLAEAYPGWWDVRDLDPAAGYAMALAGERDEAQAQMKIVLANQYPIGAEKPVGAEFLIDRVGWLLDLRTRVG